MKIEILLSQILTKTLKCLPLFLLISFASLAVVPGTSNYVVTRTGSGVPYNSIVGAGESYFSWRNTAANQTDDNRSDGTSLIGFDFWYLGIRYTTFSAGLNGTVDFSSSTSNGATGSPYGANYNVPPQPFSGGGVATGSMLALAPMYDDIWTASGGTVPIATSIAYITTGTAPNRVLTVEWINFDKWATPTNVTPASLNFQVKIYETTGKIEFVYGTMTPGSATFAYSCGINNYWTPAAAPTAAQLLNQSANNSAVFNNTPVDNLSVVPASNSKLSFASPVPSGNPTAGAPSFVSAPTQNSMTLTWVDNANNEAGYVIYKSTDNVNFSFDSQVNANIQTSVVTSLLPSTTYYFKVYAVSDGQLSSSISGSGTTAAAGSCNSTGSAAWSLTSTWSCGHVPTSGDNVIISDGNVVTLDVTGALCNSLTIGSGGAVAQLTIGNSATVRSLAVSTDITIASNGTLINGVTAAVHTISIGGNISNAGILNFLPGAGRATDITFNKNGNQTISGAGATTTFDLIKLNMGTTNSNVLDVTATNFAAPTASFLTLTNGTFKLSAAATITPFNGNVTIPSTAAIWLNNAGGTINTTAGTITLGGYLKLSSGNFNIGNAINNSLILTSGWTYIDGGTLSIKGRFANNGVSVLGNLNMTGGTLKVATTPPSVAGAPFSLTENGSSFSMSGAATIIIVNPDNGGAAGLAYINTGGTLGSVTGGTLQLGDATTAAGTTMQVNASIPIQNLVVSNGVAVTALLLTNPLTVKGNLTINSGTLNSNGLNLTVAGNWTNSGVFTPGAGTVTFNGASTVSGTSVTTFKNVLISGTLIGPSATNMIVTGNWTNDGTYTHNSGTVTFNGGAVQTLSGTSVNSFNNLTLTGAGSFICPSGANMNVAGNFANSITTFTHNNGTITFNGTTTLSGSTINNFNSIVISGTLTVPAVNINIAGSWTNTGTFTAGGGTITFNGSGIQTITNTAGETFFNLTYAATSGTGPLTLSANTDVLVTNQLSMNTTGDINLNGRTLTLGNNAIATLVHSAGRIAYGGTFKRWLPSATALSSTIAPLYGLFPVGIANGYRPVQIDATLANGATTAGYLSITHTDALTVTDIVYTDSEGHAIQRNSDMKSTVTIPGTLVATAKLWDLTVSFTGLTSVGSVANLFLENSTGGAPYGNGTTVATVGVSNPVLKRTGLTLAQITHDWVVGTTSKAASPLRSILYSRTGSSGNWNDATAAGPWSLASGGAGAACSCKPLSNAYVVISTGTTVTVNAAVPLNDVDYIDINTGGILNGTFPLVVTQDLTTAGTGLFAPTGGAWTITRNLTTAGTGISSLSAASTVTGNLNVGSGTTLNISGGALRVDGNINVDGTLGMGTQNLTFGNAGTQTLSGSLGASIISGSGSIISATAKTILSGTSLSIAPTFAITAAVTITNNGTISLTNAVTGLSGSAAGSTWTNGANSTLNIAGALLATGTLNASASGNTINYNGAGAQTIKVPASSYNNLNCSNGGTKTLGGAAISVSNLVTIQDNVTLDESTNVLSGTAGLSMTIGTSALPELILNRATSGTYPEFSGSYTLSKGKITITQTTGTATARGVSYNYLNLNGTAAYNLSSVTSIANNLDISGASYMVSNGLLTVGGTLNYSSSSGTTLANNISLGGLSFTSTSGTLTDNTKTISITGSQGWSNTGAGTITLNGKVVFSGSVSQSIGGTSSTLFNNLEINSTGGTVTVTASLTINNNFTITAGSFTASSGTMTVNGNFSNLGTFINNSGTVLFNGSSAQTVSGNATDFNNITVATGAIVSLTSAQRLLGSFTLNGTGLFNTNNTFTLVSSATATANIATLTTPANFSGSITMQRYVGGTQGYRYIGAAISGAQLSGLTPKVRLDGFTGTTKPTYWPNAYFYNETLTGVFSNGWTAPSNVTDPMTAGKGFAVYFYSTNIPLTYDLTGVPNKGNQSLPVSFTNTPNVDDGWNLVSNPYPSTIDWDAVSGWTRTNIVGNTYYVWDNANARYASYPALGPGVNGGTRYIASSQGFFVKTAAGPVLNVTESVKIPTEPSPVFWKTAATPPPAIRIKMSSPANTYEDESLIRFMEGATNIYDVGFDANKLASPVKGTPFISSLTYDSVSVCINTFPLSTTDLTVPILVKPGISGQQFIAVERLNYTGLLNLVLEDLKAGTKTDVSSSTNKYSFSMDTVTTPEKRFLLHVSFQPLSVSNIKKDINHFNSYFLENSLIIDPIAENSKMLDVEIFNLMGQSVYSEHKVNINNKMKIDFSNEPGGIYFVVCKSDQNTQVRKMNYIK
jgi:hypothetical protein